MSTQTKLDEFDHLERPTKGGFAESDRPQCGYQTEYHGECGNLVVPIAGIDFCYVHLEHAFDEESDTDSDDNPVWERKSSCPIREQ